MSGATLALSAGVLLAGASPASAYETSYVEGGTWRHGFNGVDVISNFAHPQRTHRSSVQTSRQYFSSGYRSAGYWSYASLQSTTSGNKSFYDFA